MEVRRSSRRAARLASHNIGQSVRNDGSSLRKKPKSRKEKLEADLVYHVAGDFVACYCADASLQFWLCKPMKGDLNRCDWAEPSFAAHWYEPTIKSQKSHPDDGNGGPTHTTHGDGDEMIVDKDSTTTILDESSSSGVSTTVDASSSPISLGTSRTYHELQPDRIDLHAVMTTTHLVPIYAATATAAKEPSATTDDNGDGDDDDGDASPPPREDPIAWTMTEQECNRLRTILALEYEEELLDGKRDEIQALHAAVLASRVQEREQAAHKRSRSQRAAVGRRASMSRDEEEEGHEEEEEDSSEDSGYSKRKSSRVRANAKRKKVLMEEAQKRKSRRIRDAEEKRAQKRAEQEEIERRMAWRPRDGVSWKRSMLDGLLCDILSNHPVDNMMSQQDVVDRLRHLSSVGEKPYRSIASFAFNQAPCAKVYAEIESLGTDARQLNLSDRADHYAEFDHSNSEYVRGYAEARSTIAGQVAEMIERAAERQEEAREAADATPKRKPKRRRSSNGDDPSQANDASELMLSVEMWSALPDDQGVAPSWELALALARLEASGYIIKATQEPERRTQAERTVFSVALEGPELIGLKKRIHDDPRVKKALEAAKSKKSKDWIRRNKSKIASDNARVAHNWKLRHYKERFEQKRNKWILDNFDAFAPFVSANIKTKYENMLAKAEMEREELERKRKEAILAHEMQVAQRKLALQNAPTPPMVELDRLASTAMNTSTLAVTEASAKTPPPMETSTTSAPSIGMSSTIPTKESPKDTPTLDHPTPLTSAPLSATATTSSSLPSPSNVSAAIPSDAGAASSIAPKTGPLDGDAPSPLSAPAPPSQASSTEVSMPLPSSAAIAEITPSLKMELPATTDERVVGSDATATAAESASSTADKPKAGAPDRIADHKEVDIDHRCLHLKKTAQPKLIKNGKMRDYQRMALTWFIQRHRNGVGGILGDEMGLGKTLEVISFLAWLKENKVSGPHLVVAPLSVLSAWMDEFRRWCPSLRAFRYHGAKAERKRLRDEVFVQGQFDVCVTTYESVLAAKHFFKQRFGWSYLIIDEAQRLKNEESLLSKALRGVRHFNCILLTGTPLQNNLHELWALLNFLFPEVFVSSAVFDQAFDIHASSFKKDLLRAAGVLLHPIMLRRVKKDVAPNLPDKTEIKLYVPLSPYQRFWYKRLLSFQAGLLDSAAKQVSGKLEGSDHHPKATSEGSSMLVEDLDLDEEEQEARRQAESDSGDEWRRLMSLLMQLRKVCNHPYMMPNSEPEDNSPGGDHLLTSSGKLAVLDKLLTKLKEEGHRVLLFSQFTSMLNILEDYCKWRDWRYARLDGATSRVQRTIEIREFNRPGSPMFLYLISTRAGGLGINLATADTVIHYDSDWNPQVDLQAQDRSHRIGQKKKVTVYRMVSQGTVEERIILRAQQKLYLDTMVTGGRDEDAMGTLSTKDLLPMLTFGASKIFAEDDDEGAMAAGGIDIEEVIANSLKHATTQPDLNPLEANMEELAIREFQGKSYGAKPASMRSIGTEWASIVPKTPSREQDETGALRSKRKRTSRIIMMEGDSGGSFPVRRDHVEGDIALENRVKKSRADSKKSVRKPAWTSDTQCQSCGSTGSLLSCSRCPRSYRIECLGLTSYPYSNFWTCPQHRCKMCLRSASAAGGMLFVCVACPFAFCEDHVPYEHRIQAKCKRLESLGYARPRNVMYITCCKSCDKAVEKGEADAVCVSPSEHGSQG